MATLFMESFKVALIPRKSMGSGLWSCCSSVGGKQVVDSLAFADLRGRTTMIHVIATVELQAGKREAFLEEFMRVVPLVKAEDGCVEYGGAIDVPSGLPAQIALRDDVVLVIEKWSSLDALKAHVVAAHMKVYREKIKDSVICTTLQVLSPAGLL